MGHVQFVQCARSGKDLNWFFKNWYFDNGYIDLAVDGVTKTDGGYNVAIKNIGGFVAPADVVIQYSDGSTEIASSNAGRSGSRSKTDNRQDQHDAKLLTSVTLDGGIWMDANTADNKWTPPAGM